MYPINAMMEDHANEELRYEKISNLTNSYKRSSKEDSDYNLLMQKLNSFEDNLHEHIYIENQIIFPNAITVERDMQEKGKVVAWLIKNIYEVDKILVVEWNFECIWEEKKSNFDGVSIVEFDENNRIINLREFESKSTHYYPYIEE